MIAFEMSFLQTFPLEFTASVLAVRILSLSAQALPLEVVQRMEHCG